MPLVLSINSTGVHRLNDKILPITTKEDAEFQSEPRPHVF